MSDVFISYSQKAPEPTEALADDLAKHGFAYWFDTRLLPTDKFWRVIMKRITDAKAVIVIWTPPAAESDWVYGEAKLAHEQGKLMCVRTADVLPAQVPIPFNTYSLSLVTDRAHVYEGLARLGVAASSHGGFARPSDSAVPLAAPLAAADKAAGEIALAWAEIKQSPDPDDFEAFLAHYGDAHKFFAHLAAKRIKALRAGAPARLPASVAAGDVVQLPMLASPAQAEVDAVADDVILRIEPGMHTAPIIHISASADGRLLASGSHDKTVRLWRVGADGALTLARTLRPAIGSGNDGKVYAVALAPDGSWLAAGGWERSGGRHFVTIFDVDSGAVSARLGPLPNVIDDLEVSPDGCRLAAGLGDGGIRVWEQTAPSSSASPEGAHLRGYPGSSPRAPGEGPGSPRTGQGAEALARGRSGGEWRLSFEDKDYAGDVYGLAFARDGWLATTSLDGHVRIYAPDGHQIAMAKPPGGARPFGIAISPDGARLVVGYSDTTRVDVLDAGSLALKQTLDTTGIGNGDLSSVAWLADGRIAAAGTYHVAGRKPIVVWSGNRHGTRETWPGPANTLMDLAATRSGLSYAASDPALGKLGANGASYCLLGPPKADLRDKRFEHFMVSTDGRRVRFGLQAFSDAPHLLDLGAPTLTASSDLPPDLHQADTTGLAIDGWINTTAPKLKVSGWLGSNDVALPLQQYETARSLAVAPDAKSFILGADWSLRRFDAAGTQLWEQAVPGTVWGVNLARDGRLVVAAYADGTIRWHRAEDGTELLACFIHVAWDDYPTGTPRPLGWVLWTPAGHYTCSDGADDLIGWHVNRGPDKAADFHPASRFAAAFKKPAVVLAALDGV